jgi:hypothetical protein
MISEFTNEQAMRILQAREARNAKAKAYERFIFPKGPTSLDDMPKATLKRLRRYGKLCPWWKPIMQQAVAWKYRKIHKPKTRAGMARG